MNRIAPKGSRVRLADDPAGGVRDRLHPAVIGGSEPSPSEIEAFLQHHSQLLRSTPPHPSNLQALGFYTCGVSFNAGELIFEHSTEIAFSAAIPEQLGSVPGAQLLYVTASNRASRGCEALVSYPNDSEFRAAFRVWDWASPKQADGSRFVVSLDYETLGEYLMPYELETGDVHHEFNVIRILNQTSRLDGDVWSNDVFLGNQVRGVNDHVWHYEYQWPQKQRDELLWWGPMLEAFPDEADFGATPLLGFLDTVLTQDGARRVLDSSNSILTLPTSNGLESVYHTLDTNSGMLCD